MNLTINIAGALMFCALLVVAVSVVGFTVWGINSMRELSRQYRQDLRAEGYQNALRDVAAAMFSESSDTLGGNERGRLSATGVAYWIKRRIHKEVEAEHDRMCRAYHNQSSNDATTGGGEVARG